MQHSYEVLRIKPPGNRANWMGAVEAYTQASWCVSMKQVRIFIYVQQTFMQFELRRATCTLEPNLETLPYYGSIQQGTCPLRRASHGALHNSNGIIAEAAIPEIRMLSDPISAPTCINHACMCSLLCRVVGPTPCGATNKPRRIIVSRVTLHWHGNVFMKQTFPTRKIFWRIMS